MNVPQLCVLHPVVDGLGVLFHVAADGVGKAFVLQPVDEIGTDILDHHVPVLGGLFRQARGQQDGELIRQFFFA